MLGTGSLDAGPEPSVTAAQFDCKKTYGFPAVEQLGFQQDKLGSHVLLSTYYNQTTCTEAMVRQLLP